MKLYLLSIPVIFLCISIKSLSSQTYLLGGLSHCYIPSFNDDKGSEHFDEDNYIESLGHNSYMLGVGRILQAKKLDHKLELRYSQLGAFGSYNTFDRPFWGLPGGGGINNEPDFHKQGVKFGSLTLDYQVRKQVLPNLYSSIGLGVSYLFSAVSYDELESYEPIELRKHSSSFARDYINGLKLTSGIDLEYKFLDKISLFVSCKYFLTSINSLTDAVLIRKYRPFVFQFGLILYHS